MSQWLPNMFGAPPAVASRSPLPPTRAFRRAKEGGRRGIRAHVYGRGFFPEEACICDSWARIETLIRDTISLEIDVFNHAGCGVGNEQGK